jgi:hypothetical protein
MIDHEALLREHEDQGDRFWRYRHLLRIGDQVRVRDKDPWFHGAPDDGGSYPVGAVGEIIGFAIESVCRFNSVNKVPSGIYVDQEWPLVRFGTHLIRHVRANYLELLIAGEDEQRLEANRRDTPDRIDLRGAYICDLPETTIWEGDIVRPRWKRVERLRPDTVPGLPGTYVVSWMSFDAFPSTAKESLDNPALYSLSDRLFLGSETGWTASSLELVEHGNLWRRAHGEPLTFHDLWEETAFFCQLGEMESVSHPESHSMRDLDAARQAVKDGLGHGIRYNNDFEGWGSTEYHTVIRFRDADLGRRVAAATLSSGFLIPSQDDPTATWDAIEGRKT